MNQEKELEKGMTGKITKDITVVDVQKNSYGTDIRVKEDDGAEYWTSYNEEINLD
ncbi:hypothetical protein GCM10011409_19260 [Lentibacillus populi]|uniref:Uncharacterized protein n=1 Tax=Lentibacillus populi TaxID=1827502 RepID=A0A9W5TX86_9BACI|nr:hypothetical protein [Lentibacillus populi]GGB41869.1 hypothetical protein GCM10011409_19260 [Lentibacillus populi]